jgi:hypothetical protein
VTWNRFPLSEGQWSLLSSSSPPLVAMATTVGGGRLDCLLLARLPSMLCFHPVFSLAAPRQAGGGVDPALLPVREGPRPGSSSPVPYLQAGFPVEPPGWRFHREWWGSVSLQPPGANEVS